MHLLGIDILRGIAVSTVVIYHFYILLGYATHGSFRYIHSLGELGVSLFFVISGYLIYRSVEHHITHKGTRLGIQSYTIHRLFRILPAYYFNLFIVVLLAYFVLHTIDEWSFFLRFKKILTHLTLSSYFLYQTSGFEINGAYWTLSIEMLWYILAPLFFLYIRTNKTLVFLSLLSFLYLLSIDLGFAAWLFHLDKPYFLSFQLPGQLIYFISGILIYKMGIHSSQLSPISKYFFGAIILILFLYLSSEPFFHTSFFLRNFFIVLTVSTIFILFYQYHTKKLSILSWIGKISYSLYLWHMPLLFLLKKYLLVYDFSLTMIITIFLCSLFSISACSYYVIEEGGFTLRKKFENRFKDAK